MTADTDERQSDPEKEIQMLQLRLAEAEQTIDAIRSGEVDAFAVRQGNSPAVYTLKNTDRTYRLLIEELSEGALTLNSEGRILFCNNFIAEILGISASELIGQSLFDFVAHNDHRELEDLLQKAWHVKSKGEILFRNVNSENIPMLLSASVLSVNDTKMLGIIVTDLSYQKNLEELYKSKNYLEAKVQERTKELSTAVKELSRSNQELEQFAYVASHDLKEPLRMVISFSQLLKKKLYAQADDDIRECLDYVITGSKRMSDLVHDLLAYSRVGRINTLFQLVNLNETLGLVRHNLSTIIEETKAKIILETELPVIRGINANLVQLFQNLIENALKFGGEKIPEVSIRADKKNFEWLFTVKDKGIGIDKNYLERIFIIFQRLHTKEEYPGTGIGLSICKKIVEFHGGKIWAESAPGEGTAIFFTLPDTQDL